MGVPWLLIVFVALCFVAMGCIVYLLRLEG